MGCNNTKADGKKIEHTKSVEEDTERYVTEGQAIQYVKEQLGTTDERARKIVAGVQKDKDGRISNSELVLLWGKVKQRKAEMKREFAAMDLNGSGYVTEREAVAVLCEKFPGIPEAGLKAMVKRYDKNGDGRMEYEEFIYFYGMMVAKRDSLESEFLKLDAGQLSDTDLIAMLMEQCAIEDYMARSLVEDCDVDKNGIINKEEFSSLLKNMFG